MKKGWQTKKLGDVCATIQDGAHESPQKQFDSPGEGRFLYITSKNIRTNYLELKNVSYVERDFHDRIYPRCSPRVGDVLLTKDGANTGNVALNTIDEPFSLLSSVCLIKTNPAALNSGFLCYYLQSPDGLKSIIGQMTGAAIKRIILRDVKLATIPLPPLAEQQRIVGLLDEAFAGLATAQANAEKNLQNARALFESHLQSVFTQRGPGWVDTTLDKISTNLDSKRVPITKNVRSRGEYPYYGASGIVDYVAEYIFDGDTLLVSEDGANLLARSTPIAFSVSGKYWVNNHAHILKFENMATQRFVEFYLESIKLDEYITGAAQPKLNQKALNSIPIPIPKSVETQAKIVESVESLQAETQRLARLSERKHAALEALKKSLLHQAFTGEL